MNTEVQTNVCPHCSQPNPYDAKYCPYCGRQLDDPAQPVTISLDQLPTGLTPGPNSPHAGFQGETQVMLQFLPSGSCIVLDLEAPVVLGRGLLLDVENGVDLSDFNAHKHGVSRHHCMLQRNSTALVVIDLGSRNGTFVNAMKLAPFERYPLDSGDKLILGNLHVLVSTILL